MNEKALKTIASIGLISGGVFGMVGSFAPSVSIRGLAWGLDGVGLVVGSALLTVYYFRKSHDIIAAGFLILGIGEGLILSGSAGNPDLSIPSFGAGTSLWAASLALISFQKVFPLLVRCLGLVAAILFSVVSVQIFMGHSLSALTRPLPFFAYPFFAASIFGWAWSLLKGKSFSEDSNT
jgi:hypothetical protein